MVTYARAIEELGYVFRSWCAYTLESESNVVSSTPQHMLVQEHIIVDMHYSSGLAGWPGSPGSALILIVEQ